MDSSSLNGSTSVTTAGASVTSLLTRVSAGKSNVDDTQTVSKVQPSGAVAQPNKQQSNDPAAIGQAVKKLNEVVAPALQTIQFSMDQDTNRIVVKVVDTETNKVIRQIPNEEVLAISKSLERLQGLFVNHKV